jgi:DNA-binding XRE family transcriptional regulator
MASPDFPLPIEVDQALIELGARVALRRRMMSMTQAELARQSGVSVSSIVALERGAPGVAISTLARVLWAQDILRDLGQVATIDPADPLATSRVNTVPRRVRTKKMTP